MRHVTGAFCDEVAVANGSRARNPCGLRGGHFVSPGVEGRPDAWATRRD